ncbi:extensin family protein [Novosphingopyxis sp.]|uniref:extensin family protein n=1 Tax=Novosphingopyxis sp. TaxID=2709690 RepID=UPI003B59C825
MAWRLRLLFLLLSPIMVGGCDMLPTGRGDAPARPAAAVGGAAFASAESRQCLADLGKASVAFEALPNRDFGGGCRTIDTVKLLDIGTPTTNLGALTCPLARNFAAWAQYAVQPAARQMLGGQVVRIETMGSYACRNVNGASSGKLSQHAFANAVDVSAFVLADGRRISVEQGWNGSPQERAFLRALHASACRRFGTVLGPDYNAAHYNHLHFDMSGDGYCR